MQNVLSTVFLEVYRFNWELHNLVSTGAKNPESVKGGQWGQALKSVLDEATEVVDVHPSVKAFSLHIAPDWPPYVGFSVEIDATWLREHAK